MCFYFFFFKQKTAYEMRISDWSSDVCSSDLATGVFEACWLLGRENLLADRRALPPMLVHHAPVRGIKLALDRRSRTAEQLLEIGGNRNAGIKRQRQAELRRDIVGFRGHRIFGEFVHRITVLGPYHRYEGKRQRKSPLLDRKSDGKGKRESEGIVLGRGGSI